MSVDWDGYQVFDPGVNRPLHEVSRAEARAHFEKLMVEKDQRKRALVDLVTRQGLDLDGSSESFDRFEAWFRHNAEGRVDPRKGPRLEPRWYGVVNDLGVYVGDLLIERHPNLRWELFTHDEDDISYHRPVLMGFKVKNPLYNVDPVGVFGAWGHQLVLGEDVDEGEINALIREASAAAEGRL